MEGPEHTNKRKLIVRELNPPATRKSFSDKILRIALLLLEPLVAKGKFDLVNDFGKDFAILVSMDILSLPLENYKKIGEWHRGIADFVTNFQIEPERRAYDLDCSKQLTDYITPIIKQRQEQPGDDLISTMGSTELDGHRMSTEEIAALSLNIILAATEPASKTIALLFYHLLRHPDQFRSLESDRKLIRAAVNETLRLTSPVQLIPRQPSKDVVISNVAIQEGSLIFCLIGSANRDPEIFKDPDEFNIYRTTVDSSSSCISKAEHLAFGAGIHVCVGAMFAEM